MRPEIDSVQERVFLILFINFVQNVHILECRQGIYILQFIHFHDPLVKTNFLRSQGSVLL